MINEILYNTKPHLFHLSPVHITEGCHG